MVCVVPHGYQLPFISCPKLSATGTFSARTALANWVTYASLCPAAMDWMLALYGSQAR